MDKENEQGKQKKERHYEVNLGAEPIDWETDEEVVTPSFSADEEGLQGIHTSAPEALWGFSLHETIRYTYCCRYKADSSLPYRSLHVKNDGMSVIDVAGGCFLIGGLISIATFMPTSQHQWFS
jgi:hypothetical protein